MILMSKKILIVIGVVLLLILGGWFYMNSKKTAGTASTGSSTNTTQPSTASSLKDLISKGIAQSCTFSANRTSGSVYVSGKSVRGDFETTVDNAAMKSHMIVKDNTSYVWTDGKSVGIKMSFDPSATPAATSGTTSGSFDPSVNMNYKCSAWIADSSKFDLPAGVTFQTLAVPSAGTTTTGSSSAQCSYCDSLTGDDKTQCLTALKCK
jgi:hypothetical protein